MIQFGRAHQPVRTNPQLGFKHKESWTHEKGCEYCEGFPLCQEWSRLGEKSYDSKIDEGELYKVRIDRVELMRVCNTNRCNLMGQKSIKDLQYGSTRVQRNFKVITIWKRPTKQVIATRSWMIHLRWYWIFHSCSKLKCTCELMFMSWCIRIMLWCIWYGAMQHVMMQCTIFL
jgi:hypothetical protein